MWSSHTSGNRHIAMANLAGHLVNIHASEAMFVFAATDETTQIPLRALLAYAARCARRVQGLYAVPKARTDGDACAAAIDAAISLAEDFAAGKEIQLDAASRIGENTIQALMVATQADPVDELAAYAANAAYAVIDATLTGIQVDSADDPSTVAAKVLDSATIAVDAAIAADERVRRPARMDWEILQGLHLGNFPELGDPINPRETGILGPLFRDKNRQAAAKAPPRPQNASSNGAARSESSNGQQGAPHHAADAPHLSGFDPSQKAQELTAKLRRKQKQLDAQQAALEKQKQRFENELKEFEAERNRLRSQGGSGRGNGPTSADVEAIRRELLELREELADEKSRLEMERATLAVDRATFEAEQEQFEFQASKVMRTSQDLEGNHALLAEEHERLKAQRKDLDAERARLQSALKELQNEQARLSRDREKLNNQQNRSDAGQKNVAQGNAGQQQAERKELKAQQEKLQAEIGQLKQQRALFEKDAAQLKKEQQEFVRQQADFKQAREKLQADTQKLTNGQQSLKQRSEALSADEVKIRDAQKSSAELREKLQQQQQKLDGQKKALQTEQNNVKAGLQKLNDSQGKFDQDLAKFEKDRQQFEKDRDETARKSSVLKKEQQRLELRQEELKTEQADLTAKWETYRGQQAELEKAQTAAEEDRQQLQKLQEETAAAEARVREDLQNLQQQRQEILTQRQKLKEDRDEFHKERDAFRIQCEKFEDASAKFEIEQQRILKAAGKIDEERRALEKQQTECAADKRKLQLELEQRRTAVEQIKNEYENLQAERQAFLEQKAGFARKEADVQRALFQLQQEQKGLPPESDDDSAPDEAFSPFNIVTDLETQLSRLQNERERLKEERSRLSQELAWLRANRQRQSGSGRPGKAGDTELIDHSRMRVILDPGIATAEQVAELLNGLSVLYQHLGGPGLQYDLRECRIQRMSTNAAFEPGERNFERTFVELIASSGGNSEDTPTDNSQWQRFMSCLVIALKYANGLVDYFDLGQNAPVEHRASRIVGEAIEKLDAGQASAVPAANGSGLSIDAVNRQLLQIEEMLSKLHRQRRLGIEVATIEVDEGTSTEHDSDRAKRPQRRHSRLWKSLMSASAVAVVHFVAKSCQIIPW